MSSPTGKGGRALVLRLVLAELLAKRGEGPLAPRWAARTGEGAREAGTDARREREEPRE